MIHHNPTTEVIDGQSHEAVHRALSRVLNGALVPQRTSFVYTLIDGRKHAVPLATVGTAQADITAALQTPTAFTTIWRGALHPTEFCWITLELKFRTPRPCGLKLAFKLPIERPLLLLARDLGLLAIETTPGSCTILPLEPGAQADLDWTLAQYEKLRPLPKKARYAPQST
ncbi:MAG TPA: hypothetical protein VLA19_18635 [Herpetosiphonaceae bacterium]|nr:hypothetical protein [Herpetosiphonaceae bacterium]